MAWHMREINVSRVIRWILLTQFLRSFTFNINLNSSLMVSWNQFIGHILILVSYSSFNSIGFLGKYGSYNKITKQWDGLVRHLLDRVSDFSFSNSLHVHQFRFNQIDVHIYNEPSWVELSWVEVDSCPFFFFFISFLSQLTEKVTKRLKENFDKSENPLWCIFDFCDIALSFDLIYC
jgi:hypothetical protein